MVVDDPKEALELARNGIDVVLVLAPRDAYVSLFRAGPGRVAVLVGEADDPGVAEAAAEMHRELFGHGR